VAVSVTSPKASLHQGTWFKLICGASFHHLPSIRELAFLYTLAGADCIDVAAEPAIVRAAQQGIQRAQAEDPQAGSPWLMVSLNDGEDVHFRKAILTEAACPAECSQPCVAVCPPHAVVPLGAPASASVQVHIQADLCYGCGRCEPVCPYQRITTLGYQVAVAEVLPCLLELGVQAVEIHTRVGRQKQFEQVWGSLRPWLGQLQAVSISFNEGPGLEAYLRDVLALMDPLPEVLIWQVDGRPMSGDIGAGTSKATLRLARKVLDMGLPGYVQLAGGTNAQTVSLLDPSWPVAGIAFGSYARQLVAAYLEEGSGLATGILLAKQLVQQVKQRPVALRQSCLSSV